MRKIIFRGKRVDNSEWVEGYYCRAFRWAGDKEPVPAIQENDSFMFRTIDPETVGQYTGLIDKNGKMIYENDILNCEVVGIQYPAKVVFKNGSFGVAYTHRGIDYFNPFTSFVESVEFEIIGNIHDNPELLKGE